MAVEGEDTERDETTADRAAAETADADAEPRADAEPGGGDDQSTAEASSAEDEESQAETETEPAPEAQAEADTDPGGRGGHAEEDTGQDGVEAADQPSGFAGLAQAFGALQSLGEQLGGMVESMASAVGASVEQGQRGRVPSRPDRSMTPSEWDRIASDLFDED